MSTIKTKQTRHTLDQWLWRAYYYAIAEARIGWPRETEFGMLRLLFIDSLCYKGTYLHSVGVFTYLGSAMASRTPFKVTARM